MINGVKIDFISHETHRFPTVGDYFVDENGYLNIKVSRMNSQAYECMVAIHEFVEWLITDLKGIKESTIMDFDLMFEKEREEGKHTDDEEPGFDNRSPYLDAHTLSTSIEMMICAFLGISWSDYNKFVMAL